MAHAAADWRTLACRRMAPHPAGADERHAVRERHPLRRCPGGRAGGRL